MPDSTSTRLVVNADQFGASGPVSRGIVKAHLEGIVTSTSIMGNVPDPAAIKRQLAEAPELGVGVQLVLVRGRPVSPPESIPTLVDEGGMLPLTPGQFLSRWARSRIAVADLEREMDAQVVRFRDVGLPLDHLDTFLNLGFLPAIAEVMEKVAERHGIAHIRTTVEDPNLTWFADLERGVPLALFGGLSWLARRRMGTRRHAAQTWGYAESGNLGRMRILEILGRMGPGIHELICHPGETASEAMTMFGRWRLFDRPRELRALTSPLVKTAVARRQIQLCRFHDLFG